MKKKHLHIILLICFTLCFSKVSFGLNSTQRSDKIRTFDENFKDRYTSSKYNYEGDAIINKTPQGSGKYEEYKKDDIKQREQNNNNVFSINLEPFSWFFYIAITIAVVFLVYILITEGGSNLFTSNKNKIINTHDDITADNIENADIHALIKHAENENNYRLAIRYYYLLVLKTLSLRNHIKFEDDKTNNEYLNEIKSKSFSKDFAYISYLYNYIWYGEFPLNINKYNKAKSNFYSFLNQVKS